MINQKLNLLLGIFFTICLATPVSTVAQLGQSDFKPIRLTNGVLSEDASNFEKSFPKLTISDVKFLDDDQNNVLNAFEKAQLVFKISNNSRADAHNLILKVTNIDGNRNIILQNNNSTIPKLSAGEERNVIIGVEGLETINNGISNLKLELIEPKGFDANPVLTQITTKSFDAPNVYIEDYTFITSDKSTTISKGEPVTLRLRIANNGTGIAKNTVLSIDLPQNVLPIGDDVFPIGTLLANETKSVDFKFVINTRFSLESTNIKANLRESYQRYAMGKQIPLVLGADTVRPAIVSASSYSTPISAVSFATSSDIDTNIPELGRNNKHSYALIIGNENYNKYNIGLSSEVNVDFARQDAQTFSAYANKTLGIPADNIQVLVDATAAQIKKSIEILSKIIKTEDGKAMVYVYYAGHGFPDEQTRDSYLIPVDVSGTNVTDGINLSYLTQQLTLYPSQGVVVFLDACFSGGARNQSLLASRGIKVEPKKGTLNGKILLFSATSSNQSALQYRDKQHGIFTYYLLKELQQNSNTLTMESWFNNVRYNVALSSLKINQKDQEPQIQVSEDWKNWGDLRIK